MIGQTIALALFLSVGARPQASTPPPHTLGLQMQQALADRYLFRLSNVCDLLLFDLAGEKVRVSQGQRMPMAMVCVQSKKADFDWGSAQRLLERAGIPIAVPAPAGVPAPNAVPHPPE